MEKLLLTLLALIFPFVLFSQDTENYPVATPTDQPDVVISPYAADRRLDVAGLAPGSLAEDPVAKKIFRIPFSNPGKRHYEDYTGNRNSPEPLPQIPSTTTTPPPTQGNPGQFNAPRHPAPNQLPDDLLSFLFAFNQNSAVNDPDALMPFYAPRLESYFGEKNVTKATIRADRAAYINRFPQREYILDGQPVLLSQSGNAYEVMTRVRYSVRGQGKVRTGSVSDYFKIIRGERNYQIVSINEAKAGAVSPEIQKQDSERFEPQVRVGNPGKRTIYEQFEMDQIHLFIDAFAASGEVDEPGAMIEFMHPNIVTYYNLKNPTRQQLLNDRISYLKRWPERRYWLAEKPRVFPVDQGAWDVVAKMGYEVKNGSRRANSVATSEMRISQTPLGLKILSIKEK